MKATKVSVIFLLAALMLVLCACGGTQAAEEPATAPAAEAPAEPTVEPTVEPTAEPTEAPLTMENVLGVLEGQVYTNPLIGIGCELNDEWTYFDADQLSQLGGVVKDALPDDISQLLDNGGVLYAMYASADGGLRTASIVFEKLNVINSIVLDESGYIEAAMPQLSQALEAAGLNVSVCEHTTVNFAGMERECIRTEGEAAGALFFQYTIPIKCGNYMASCTISCFQTDTLDDIAAAFYIVE